MIRNLFKKTKEKKYLNEENDSHKNQFKCDSLSSNGEFVIQIFEDCCYMGKPCVGYDGNGIVEKVMCKCPLYHNDFTMSESNKHYSKHLTSRFKDFYNLARLLEDINNVARVAVNEEKNRITNIETKIAGGKLNENLE
ncbi:MAG: hypothetical protein PHH54_02360 [Candidatus Nanoarchaeia archaeon]|nr:hypothetical protein [Candidatus Nanoarchaeia archaeon]MDD5740805.1 hypothetical protein [Candidatus Nanoarchaeia archaeon]